MLAILPRPTLPMPPKALIEVSTTKDVLDYHREIRLPRSIGLCAQTLTYLFANPVDSYPVNLSFVNDLRRPVYASGIAVFAPRTPEPLPGIAYLEHLLTKRPEGEIQHEAATIVSIPGDDASEAELRNFMPQVVLVHNAMSLYALPKLAELRKRPETKFYSFGTAKDIYGTYQIRSFLVKVPW